MNSKIYLYILVCKITIDISNNMAFRKCKFHGADLFQNNVSAQRNDIQIFEGIRFGSKQAVMLSTAETV